MTKDEALDLALDALDNLLYWDNGKSDYDQAREAITAIKQARSAPVQEPYGYVSTHTNGLMHFNKTFQGVYTDTATEIVAVYTAAQPAPDCTRSHPHENMDAMCELRTEIARLTNENARLKAAQPAPQEPQSRIESAAAKAVNYRTDYQKPLTVRLQQLADTYDALKEEISALKAAPMALTDGQLADRLPDWARIIEREGERKRVSITRQQIHAFICAASNTTKGQP